MPSPCPVDQVIVDPAPLAANPRGPAETQAFLELSRSIAEDPQGAIQTMVELALRLTGAESSGVSVLDAQADPPVFRWVATAGQLTRYLGATMPADFSPCGEVLARARPLMMRDPIHCYPSLGELHVPCRYGLFVPFSQRGKLVGTVWVVAHREHAFTTEDVRAVGSLTTFATMILDAMERRRPANP